VHHSLLLYEEGLTVSWIVGDMLAGDLSLIFVVGGASRLEDELLEMHFFFSGEVVEKIFI